jgi:hypothetical protein
MGLEDNVVLSTDTIQAMDRLRTGRPTSDQWRGGREAFLPSSNVIPRAAQEAQTNHWTDAQFETAFHQHARCIADRAHVGLQGFIEAVRSLH